MTQKLSKKLLCLVMILTLLFPTYLFDRAYAASKYTDKYNLQIKTTGVVSPAATTNPFTMKQGEKINLAVEVCDQNGYEYTEEDPDFGDEEAIYTDVVWKTDGGLKVKGYQNFVSVEALTTGTHYIDVSYNGPIAGQTVKPLRIEVNVTANTDNSKIIKMKAVDTDSEASHLTGTNGENLSLKVGETVNLKMQGFAGDGTALKPDLKLTLGQSYSELDVDITNGCDIAITGNKELKSKITFTDANGSYFDMNVTIIDDGSFPKPLKWNFDAETGTLNGLLDKDNPTELTIPATIKGVPVKHIGKNAFKYSSSGGTVNNRITKLILPEGLETTDYMSFQGNDIKEITIPSTMTEIGQRTFFGNDNLTTINFSDKKNLKTIGDSAFYKTGLTTVTVPEGVTKIAGSAFKECPLTSAVLPSTLEFIGEQAFALDMVEEMTIPAGVKTLNENSRGKQGSGLFFRNFSKKTTSTAGTLRLAKVNDLSGNATAANTRAVVNPAPVTINFKDESGKTIKDSMVATGAEYNTIKMVEGNYRIKKATLAAGDSHYYTDYLMPFDAVDVYTKEDFANKIIGENYFAKGNTYTFAAPAVKGYLTPEAQTVKLDKENNSITFVYKEAEKLNITLNGEGLSIDGGETKVPEGTEVTVRVHEPSKKALEKLTVNGEDVTDSAKFDGIDYTYSFTVNKNAEVTCTYKDSDAANDFVCSFDKDTLTLGDDAKLKISYRGKALDISNKLVTVTAADGKKIKIDDKAQLIKALDAGDISITVAVGGYEALTKTLTLKVNPMKVSIRMEDDANTAFANKEVSIDKLYLTKGETYYNDLTFDYPVPLLAAQKLLAENGVNTADKIKFDCGSTGTWMAQMGGTDHWVNMNENGSFMYTVNDVLSGDVISAHKLKENDRICIFYDPNWMDTSTVAFFEKDSYEITAGESVNFKLLYRPITWDGSVPDPLPLKDAYLEINDGKDGISEAATDANGMVTYTFDKPGTYKISAVSNTVPSPFSRPYTVVTVKEDPDTVAAAAVDEKIANIGEVTLDSKAAIEDARASYEALSPAAKEKVQNLDTLEAAEKKLAELSKPENPDPEKPDPGNPDKPNPGNPDNQDKPQKPDTGNNNSGNSGNTNAGSRNVTNNNTGAPKTGDAGNPLLFSIMLISALSLAMSVRRKEN